jgi:hypothetical protein
MSYKYRRGPTDSPIREEVPPCNTGSGRWDVGRHATWCGCRRFAQSLLMSRPANLHRGMHSTCGIVCHTDPETVTAVREWPTLKNKQDIRSFLWLCVYYRRFISGLTDIANMLTKLTEKSNLFTIIQKWKESFKTLAVRPMDCTYFCQPSAKRLCPITIPPYNSWARTVQITSFLIVVAFLCRRNTNPLLSNGFRVCTYFSVALQQRV